MMKVLTLAGLMVATLGGLAGTADAQQYRDGPRRVYDRDYRGGIDRDYRRAGPTRYWTNSLGQTCYRRGDGVRRCEYRGNDRPRGWRGNR